MADNDRSGSSSTSLPDNGDRSTHPERVGEILKRARESRQISIEAIAKRLRLNARYIEALEANQYDQLPGDTYIRVYLRSLSGFLALDSEEIFRCFFEERGVTGADTLRKDSRTKINLAVVPDKQKPSATLIITISVIALLALLSFIFNSQRMFPPHHNKKMQVAGDSTPVHVAMPVDSARQGIRKSEEMASPAVERIDTHRIVEKAVAKNEKTDTVRPAAVVNHMPVKSVDKKNEVKTVVTAPPKVKDTAKPATVHVKAPKDSIIKTSAAVVQSPKDTAQKRKPEQAKPAQKLTKDTAAATAKTVVRPPLHDTVHLVARKADTVKKNVPAVVSAIPAANKPMKLRMTVIGDSCWARVFSDGGNQWRNVVARDRGVTFTAQDSFNVHVGSSKAVSFTLNGKPLTLPDKKSVLSFKVDKTGALIVLTIDQWNAAFKDAPFLPAAHVDR